MKKQYNLIFYPNMRLFAQSCTPLAGQGWICRIDVLYSHIPVSKYEIASFSFCLWQRKLAKTELNFIIVIAKNGNAMDILKQS
jgi:hypothetical protein